jgi:hypothetical protein
MARHIHVHLYDEVKHDPKTGQFAPKYGPGGSHEHRMHELSPRRLDEEYEKASKASSGTTHRLIEAGHGHTRYNEIAKMAEGGHDLAKQHVITSGEQHALGSHREYRRTHGEKFVRMMGKRNLEERQR